MSWCLRRPNLMNDLPEGEWHYLSLGDFGWCWSTIAGSAFCLSEKATAERLRRALPDGFHWPAHPWEAAPAPPEATAAQPGAGYVRAVHDDPFCNGGPGWTWEIRAPFDGHDALIAAGYYRSGYVTEERAQRQAALIGEALRIEVRR